MTTVLVGLASRAALPVSTTHFHLARSSASACIAGPGRSIGPPCAALLGWLVTLPVAALVGRLAFALYTRA